MGGHAFSDIMGMVYEGVAKFIVVLLILNIIFIPLGMWKLIELLIKLYKYIF